MEKDCECKNWCQDGRDMYAPHHYRCQHYAPPPTDPRYARFGKAMWDYIGRLGGDFCGAEISEDILPLAEAAGLCCRMEYDPDLHGEMIDAEPGTEIWWWGDCHVFSSPNVKEHAPLSARAHVDHGVDVETTEDHVNRAADRGCCVSSCSPLMIFLYRYRMHPQTS